MNTIIWDYNGTIIDDLDLCVRIENEILKKVDAGITITPEMYRDLFCFPVIHYYHKIGFPFEKISYPEVSNIFHARYAEHFHECRLTEGFEEVIRLTQEKGYQNVILSAAEDSALQAQCSELGIDRYFTAIMGMQNNLAESKVDMALEWMEKAGVNADECMYIGDTTHDQEVAEALGIKKIYLVACGHQSWQVLRSVSDNVYRNLREMADAGIF